MKNFDIRKKFMIILLIGTILPLSLTMLITYIYAHSYFDDEVLSYNENLMYQFSTNIDNYLQDVSDYIYYPYSNFSVNSLLSTSAPNYNSFSVMLDFMQLAASPSDDISEIRLASFSRNTMYSYHEKQLSVRALNNEETEKLIEEASGAAAAPRLLPTHQVSYSTNASKDLDKYVFTISYLMEAVPRKDLMGILTIDLSLATIDTLSSQMLSSPDEVLTITDAADNALIYSTDYSLIEDSDGYNEYITGMTADITSHSGYITRGLGLNSSFVFYETIEMFHTTWLITKEIPASSVFQNINDITRLYIPVYLFFLCISILFTMQITRRFTAPIIRLTRQMSTIRYGEPFEPVVMDQNDEIGMLNNTFNEMVEKINDMILNEYELKLSTKNAQLRMLQAQLNPHFLNNALQSLGTLALEKKSPEIYSLITSLSVMMNYVMDIKNSLVLLEREFEYTENYLIFQRQRFGEEVHFTLSPAPETLALLVPKMILQPLVENYFKHGFVKRSEGYQITARSYIEDSTLYIIVENNGECIDEESLKRLRQNLSQTTEIKDNDENAFGIGLYNIQTRLNLYYNHHGHISLENKTPYGVRTELRLSLKEAPNENTDY